MKPATTAYTQILKPKQTAQCADLQDAHLNALDAVLYAAFAKNYESLRVAVNRVERLIEKKYGKGNEK
nr:MAG TPA: hypothetical protein [Caudoviricetes sp.]